MIMKLAIVGNREGWSEDYVNTHTLNYIIKELNGNFPDILTLKKSGVCENINNFCYVHKENITSMRFINGKRKINSLKRIIRFNKKIAEECDIMIAFNKGNKPSGTLNAINQAKKLGKEVIVISE